MTGCNSELEKPPPLGVDAGAVVEPPLTRTCKAASPRLIDHRLGTERGGGGRVVASKPSRSIGVDFPSDRSTQRRRRWGACALSPRLVPRSSAPAKFSKQFGVPSG
jgi:hypothetical protein